MLSLIRYWWHSFFHPEYRDFLDMGMGIKARYARCKRDWNPHLERSKSFQARLLSQPHYAESLIILGSGRLLDFDTKLIAKTSKHITCVDADPSAKQVALKKLSAVCQVDYLSLDITGSLQRWSRELQNYIFRLGRECPKHEVAKFLTDIRCSLPIISLPDNSTLLSLNLLGQIPLYWRDRVFALLKSKWKIVPDEMGNLDESLQSALTSSMAELQRGHLDFINSLNLKAVLIITDNEFRYYDKAGETFLVEQAMFCSPKNHLTNYKLSREDEWIWEVAPIGVEEKHFGVKHQIRAFEFLRKSHANVFCRS